MADVHTHTTPRRGFLARIATMSVAFGAAIPTLLHAQQSTQVHGSDRPDVDEWLGALKGKHRQVLDAVSVNDGASLMWSAVFLNSYNQAAGIADSDLGAVTVLRHSAIPIAFNDAIWARYKLGEAFGVEDPFTKAPALRNPYWHASEDEPASSSTAVETLLARGVIFGLCKLATTHNSARRARAVGVPQEEALKEWMAGVIPGITLVPSGIWAVNHAQEQGCTYCYAG
jgi:hypothetical protein